MSKSPDVIWLNTSSSLQCFARPLLCYLARQVTIEQWEYCQSQDEASSLDIAVLLLHDYLKSCNQPVNLVGHSTGGLLGLLYARQYPEKVKSLTLLAVGVDAAVDWQAHYYFHFHNQILPFSRQGVLSNMAYNLFGYQERHILNRLVRILEEDLDCSLSPHSVFQLLNICRGGTPVPLMVCGSRDDIIIEPNALQGWQPWLKEGDRLWSCLEGRHFFHFFQPQQVGQQIFKFWKSLRQEQGVGDRVWGVGIPYPQGDRA